MITMPSVPITMALGLSSDFVNPLYCRLADVASATEILVSVTTNVVAVLVEDSSVDLTASCSVAEVGKKQ